MKNTQRKKCKARNYRGEYTCVECNLTWSSRDTKPECRPFQAGDKALKKIREILKL